MVAAHALEIAHFRQGPILRFREKALGGSLQQLQLLTKQRNALVRQRLDQVFQHGPQPSGDLDTRASELPNLRDGQGDEILPVGRAKDEAHTTRRVTDSFVVKAAMADVAQ